MKELIEAGRSRRQIADELNLSISTIHKNVRAMVLAGELGDEFDVMAGYRAKREKIVSMVEGGASHDEVCSALGVSQNMVSAAIADAGVLSKRDAIAAQRRARILELYAAQTPISDIAEDVGVTKACVYAVTADAGVRVKTCSRHAAGQRARKLNDVEAKKMVSLHLKWVPLPEILKRYGVSHATFYKYLKADGRRRTRASK